MVVLPVLVGQVVLSVLLELRAVLAAVLSGSVPVFAGSVLEASAVTAHSTARAAAHAAADALHAVVPDNKLPFGVIGGTADVGTVCGRSKVDRCDPRERDRRHDHDADDAGEETAGQFFFCAQKINNDDGRDDHVRLEHLHVEADADHHGAKEQITPFSGLNGPEQEPRRHQKHKDELHIHRVVARGDHDGRRQGEHKRRDQPGGAPETLRRQHIHHHAGSRARKRLRKQHHPPVVAERQDEQRLHPQPERRLVDRDEPGGVERNEKEIVPALRHAFDGRGIVSIAVAEL